MRIILNLFIVPLSHHAHFQQNNDKILFLPLTQNGDIEQESRNQNEHNSPYPTHTWQFIGRESYYLSVIEEIKYHNQGVVQEMGTYIHHHRAGIIEKVSENHTNDSPRHEGVDLAVGQAEKDGGHEDSHMSVLEPLVHGLLHDAAEEKLLADGRHHRQDKDVEYQVADADLAEERLQQLLVAFGYLS